MKHFLQLGQFDPTPLALSLQRQAKLWNKYRFRTTYQDTPHTDVADILLRFSAPGETDPEKVRNDFQLVFYGAWHALPEAHDVVFDLMRRVRGVTLGRVLISRLPPGGQILAHMDDDGAYVQDGMRLHAVVQGLPGAKFHCGPETAQMLTGTVWWFDHKQMHAVENHSADDRIHLIVDVKTAPSSWSAAE